MCSRGWETRKTAKPEFRYAGEPATTMGGIEIANRRAMRQDIIERNARIENILRKMKEPEATRFSEAVEAYNRQMRKAGTIER